MLHYKFFPIATQINYRAKLITANKIKFGTNFIKHQMLNSGTLNRNYAGIGGIPGSGAGKGGGGGGTVRESGGGLGKYGAAKEEAYFYNKQKKQLERLKKQAKDSDKIQKGTE